MGTELILIVQVDIGFLSFISTFLCRYFRRCFLQCPRLEKLESNGKTSIDATDASCTSLGKQREKHKIVKLQTVFSSLNNVIGDEYKIQETHELVDKLFPLLKRRNKRVQRGQQRGGRGWPLDDTKQTDKAREQKLRLEAAVVGKVKGKYEC